MERAVLLLSARLCSSRADNSAQVPLDEANETLEVGPLASKYHSRRWITPPTFLPRCSREGHLPGAWGFEKSPSFSIEWGSKKAMKQRWQVLGTGRRQRDKNNFLGFPHDAWCKISVLLLRETHYKEHLVSPLHSLELGVQRR